LWCARFWIDDFSNHRKVVKVAHETILRHLQIAGIDLSYHRVNQQFVRSDELEKKPVKERLVKRVELFDVLEDQQLSMLAEAMQERTYGAKEKIVIQDEEGSSLFIVAEGVVSILKRDEEGYSQWMAHIEPGQYFGEMSLLTGQARAATAQADTEVVCYEITKDILKPIFEKEPGLLQKISLMMSERQLRLSRVQAKEAQPLAAAEKEKTAVRLLKQIQDFFGVRIR
jgi:CRP-like cAMP-binding protein